MKNVLKILILSFSLLSIFSCLNKCKDVDCNSGTCDSGTCVCEPGFEGEFCERDWRSSFTRDWTITDQCSGQNVTYTLTILENPSDYTRVIINNLDEEGFSEIIGSMNNSSTINIPIQTLSTGDVIIGTIRLDSPIVQVSYSVNPNTSSSRSCSFTGI